MNWHAVPQRLAPLSAKDRNQCTNHGAPPSKVGAKTAASRSDCRMTWGKARAKLSGSPDLRSWITAFADPLKYPRPFSHSKALSSVVYNGYERTDIHPRE